MRPWRFATALAVGVSHVRAGMPCQDRLRCRTSGSVLVAAIADGAGSAACAEEGAELVVATIVESITPDTSQPSEELADTLRSAIAAARDAVFALASQRGLPPREFASTVLAVVATESAAACAQLGDGLIAASEGGSEWGYVFWPQRGEFANTTYFLTDADALERLSVDSMPSSVTDFALMSDGLEPLALGYASQAAHAPFFTALFAPLHRQTESGFDNILSAQLLELIQSPRITSRVDDDISLVLATRRPGVALTT